MTIPVLKIPVYEPAGRDLAFSETDLLQHLLVIGATGSGKTALLHRIIEQMIRRPGVGLLIFDPKQDDTVQRVRRLARKMGRSGDVVVVGPDGNRYLNLFARFRSLADVDMMASRLLLGSGSMGRDNAYWDETRLAMIDAALSLLVAQGRRIGFDTVTHFMREWFFREEKSDYVLKVIATAQSEASKMSGPEKQKLLQALDTVALWKTLDPRTRSNILSTLIVAIRPLLSIAAARCFQPHDRSPFDMAETVNDSRICVASLNAAADPAAAALFFRLVKAEFFRAVQSRGGGRQELCGLIADEWPLIATADDVEALATVRSRHCFVAAATQGLSILDERLGPRLRKALLANFGSVVFMRSREEETDLFAVVHLGRMKRLVKSVAIETEGDLISRKPVTLRQEVFVCPLGTLGRLSPHQGYIASPAWHCNHPLTFLPWYEEEPKEMDPASPERLKKLLAAQGFAECMDPLTFRRALQLCAKRADRQTVLARAREFFNSRGVLIPDGLETLPTPWLRGLPGILRAARLLWDISMVEMVDDLLQLHFVEDSVDRNEEWDRMRLAVNAALYPCRWRPLKPRHAQILSDHWREFDPADADSPQFE